MTTVSEIPSSHLTNGGEKQVADLTSSIGPTYPPEGTSFERIKAFDTRRIVRNLAEINEYAVEMRTLVDKLAMEGDGKYTRISFRFIAANRVVAEAHDLLSEYGEVVLPLFGAGDGFDDYSMVYLGYNLPGQRDGSKSDQEKSMLGLKNALVVQPRTYEEIIDRMQAGGYELSVPSLEQRTTDNRFRTRIAELYARFNWSPTDVFEMLEKETNIIAVALFDGEVVGAGLAELVEVVIQDGGTEKELRIAELTEAATAQQHKGRGVYTAVAARLLREMAMLPDERKRHMVLGESNGLAPGVLKAAKALGRTFAYEVAQSLGLPVSGYLAQHAPITDPDQPSETKYNDLFPAYITAADIDRLYGSDLR